MRFLLFFDNNPPPPPPRRKFLFSKNVGNSINAKKYEMRKKSPRRSDIRPRRSDVCMHLMRRLLVPLRLRTIMILKVNPWSEPPLRYFPMNTYPRITEITDIVCVFVYLCVCFLCVRGA